MRLIHSTTLELKEFYGEDMPPYAILSHTWGKDEVSLQDMEGNAASYKSGFEKIQRCCQQAAVDGFEYAWVDTCCIDKKSSSELTEAINSMYRWYQDAEVCYVYLADVYYSAQNRRKVPIHEIKSSRWFTRGWTLQELIAPSSLIFFSNTWDEIGTKSNLQAVITEVTKIPEAILYGQEINTASVAQRMSWASRRETTRIEDLAYCLMGIFHVNMPMLYGEGERAFIRLQEEIIKSSQDHSIFAWKTAQNDPRGRGLLALRPSEFVDSGQIVPFRNVDEYSLSSTNRGIHLLLELHHLPRQATRFYAYLNCHIARDAQPLAIKLRKSHGPDQYQRVESGFLSAEYHADDQMGITRQKVYVKQETNNIDELGSNRPSIVIADSLRPHGIFLADRFPSGPSAWSSSREIDISVGPGQAAVFRFHVKHSQDFLLLFEPALHAPSVRLELANNSQRLEEVVEELHWKNINFKTPEHFQEHRASKDRLKWQHPWEKWWICLTIKRQMVAGQPSSVIDMKYYDKVEDVSMRELEYLDL